MNRVLTRPPGGGGPRVRIGIWIPKPSQPARFEVGTRPPPSGGGRVRIGIWIPKPLMLTVSISETPQNRARVVFFNVDSYPPHGGCTSPHWKLDSRGGLDPPSRGGSSPHRMGSVCCQNQCCEVESSVVAEPGTLFCFFASHRCRNPPYVD